MMEKKFYVPAEDSALLGNCAMENVGKMDCVLDLGTGSGYVASKIEKGCLRVIGSDINPQACTHAKKKNIDVIQSNLMDAFKENSFDIVLFNPPYLPEDEHTFEEWFERATVGGETGREIIENFLDDLKRVLTPRGYALLLASTKTGIFEIETYAKEKGFDANIIAEDTYYDEKLVVFNITPY